MRICTWVWFFTLEMSGVMLLVSKGDLGKIGSDNDLFGEGSPFYSRFKSGEFDLRQKRAARCTALRGN